ncbi:MAG TPA: ATP-binding protein [Bacteroidales bacterium]|nr:ATP-binding protein [Bacteroidales bacterium]
MVYKNFRINLLIRIVVLALTVFSFFYFISTETFLTPILILTLAILQVYSMFRYVDKTNRDLASFLESIRFSEFTRSFQIEGMGSSFNDLNKAFNDVIADFQKVRSEKEEHFHYLQSIVQNIDISIIAYQPDGTVEMINKTAKKLFQLSNIKNIHKLSIFSDELVDTLLNIKPGENKLVKVQDEDDLLQLAINSTELKIKEKIITLATIKNIQNVLEEQETEAWQKLIRVLTHEIMNSITPIASLSATLENILKPYIHQEDEVNELDNETLAEIHQALQTINKRSTGLLHFVNTYRNLTRIPKPNFIIVKVTELFDNIGRLLEKELKESHIEVISRIEPGAIEISMDEQLIEQVLINLMKNSIHALDGRTDSTITLRAFFNKRGRPTIQVTDNGVGILKEVLDKIFIPFFTTKPSGSGIGLSLSRQILRLHGGTITAQSIPEKETTFTLTF